MIQEKLLGNYYKCKHCGKELHASSNIELAFKAYNEQWYINYDAFCKDCMEHMLFDKDRYLMHYSFFFKNNSKVKIVLNKIIYYLSLGML